MDKTKQPGINCKSITMKKLSFSRETSYPKGDVNVEIKFDAMKKIAEDNKSLICILKAIVALNDIKDPSKVYFNFETEFIGTFVVNGESPNMELEQFGKNNAPAIILPYIRETLSSITTKAGFKPVYIPPINIIAFNSQTENAVEAKPTPGS